MGLFDKLRRNDQSEEVELKPAQHASFDRTRRRVNNPDVPSRRNQEERDAQDEEEVELEDMWEQNRKRAGSDRSQTSGRNRRADAADTDEDDSDDFILPGMKTVADEETDGEDRDRAMDGSGEKLDRLLDQNERIITLLEDIADMTGDETDSSTTDAATDTGMW